MNGPKGIYQGRRGKHPNLVVFVPVDGDGTAPPQSISPRFDLANHSPDGFEWGYGGSGPAQLALAILAHFTGDDAYALRRYQEFKWAHVATQPSAGGGMNLGGFVLTSEQVRAWIEANP